jgi:ABC-type Zn uptake system ZnuABC Zn-binding protein ZnuA
MRLIQGAQVVVMNGAGLEDFLTDALSDAHCVIDASEGIELHCPEEHDHDGHHHEADPHIWLSPELAKQMCQNICIGLSEQFPQYTEIFNANLASLLAKLDALQAYGNEELQNLQTRELITFHDGFGYFAAAFDLHILEAVEEESGSEASAKELIHMIEEVQHHQLPAVFTEKSGSVSAAGIIARETGAKEFSLDMAMAGDSYFEAMYRNINTLKEALQ